jgi:hypothetical protein
LNSNSADSETTSETTSETNSDISSKTDNLETATKNILRQFANKTIKLKIHIGSELVEIIIRLKDDLMVDLENINKENNEIFYQYAIQDFYYFKSSSFKTKREINPTFKLFQLSNRLSNDNLYENIHKTDVNMKTIFDKIITELNNMRETYFENQTKDINEINKKNRQAVKKEEGEKQKELQQEERDAKKEGRLLETTEEYTELIGGNSTDPFFQHNINKFIEWVHNMSTQYTQSSKIHVVTHSDCMQSFLSKINISNYVANTQYGEFFGPVDIIINQPTRKENRVLTSIPAGSNNNNVKKINANNWKKGENETNKKYNKPLLSPQNVWDLTFTTEFSSGIDESIDVNFSLRNITGHSGIPKPNKSIFFDSCEYNCDFSQGIGMNNNKTKKCTNELYPKTNTGFFRRMFTRKVPKLVKSPKIELPKIESPKIESPKKIIKDVLQEEPPKKRYFIRRLFSWKNKGGKTMKTINRQTRKPIYK